MSTCFRSQTVSNVKFQNLGTLCIMYTMEVYAPSWVILILGMLQISFFIFFKSKLAVFCLFVFNPPESLALPNWLAITQEKIYLSQAVTAAVLTSAVLSYMLCPYSYCIELSYVIYRYKLLDKGFVANTYIVLRDCCFSRNYTFFSNQLQKLGAEK